jgi:hypothetical protein
MVNKITVAVGKTLNLTGRKPLMSNQTIGPYFSDINVTAETCLHMLHAFLTDFLVDVPLRARAQQHILHRLRATFLTETFKANELNEILWNGPSISPLAFI